MKKIICAFIGVSFLFIFFQGEASEIRCQSLDEITQKGILSKKTLIFTAKVKSQSRSDTTDTHVVQYCAEDMHFLQGGCACTVRKLIYQQPVLMKKVNGKIFGVSVTLPCSGKEFSLKNSESYIFFSNSACEKGKTVAVFRVEPMENKNQVMLLIKSANQPIPIFIASGFYSPQYFFLSF